MSSVEAMVSTEAENLLLGRMINSLTDAKACCQELQNHHFYTKENRILFSCMQLYIESNQPFEMPLLIEFLKRENKLLSVGNITRILELSQLAPGAIHIEHYMSILKESWAKRWGFQTVNEFLAELKQSKNITLSFEEFSKKFSKQAKKLNSTQSLSFASISKKDGAKGYINILDERRKYFNKYKKPFVDGVPSGYPDLDEIVGGLGNSNLIILASRPGMGKTAFALNLAQKIADKSSIGIISLEMSSMQLYERMISIESEIPGNKLREGKISNEEWGKLLSIEEKVSKMPIFIQEGISNLSEIITQVRVLKEEKGIELLIIDYLQLLQAKGETRLLEISNITRELKNLAMELHIPIVCLAQLSRKVEERNEHRPLLSDLRESGSIEQDADVVMFLLRHEYYDKNDRPGQAELIVAKNRHGQTGTAHLYFANMLAKFSSYSSKQQNVIEDF
ncbi:MAG: replicative DNA helicase [Rhabdochlamydiaceae bacterium]|nr:replicative DNA helicase [Candidatus Amphrikana amoebophyrae]